MSKQRILTTLAAVFSLLIVVGGWFITNELFEQQHAYLMNTVHSISVQEPPEAELSVKPAKTILSIKEIADILRVWQSGQEQHYHDPYDGQLTMEEAIKAANSGLSYFCEKGVLPKELIESSFTQTNAFLSDVEVPRPVPSDYSFTQDLAYSFWLVTLSNRAITIKLTINAQMGQIWMADMSSVAGFADFNDTKTLDVLKLYEAYLGLSGGGGLKSNEESSIKSYGNDQIGIEVSKKTGEYEFLHFSLVLTR